MHEAGPVTAEDFDAVLGDTAIIIGQIDLPESRLKKAPCLRAIFNVEGNFLPNVDYAYCFRQVKLGAEHTERVFTLQGIERYPGPFGLWSGRTPDGSWMFVRDRSTQEVYSLNIGGSK